MNEAPLAANSDDDILWMATRYVCDELTEAERASFEERLLSDEAACLAVADVVRISAGLSASPRPIPAVDPQPPQRRRILAVASCGLAILLAGFAFLSGQNRQGTTGREMASAELVGRWTAVVSDSLEDELAWDDEVDADSELVEASLDAPDWLLAAVMLQDEIQDPAGDVRLQDENL